MHDFLAFEEGRQYIEGPGDGGWPDDVEFGLSTQSIDEFSADDEYEDGPGIPGEIEGTGYGRKTQETPAATGLGAIQFLQMSWLTEAATDWPDAIYTVVAVKPPDSGDPNRLLLAAWHLQAGGAPRDASGAGTTLNVTPKYDPTNPPHGD